MIRSFLALIPALFATAPANADSFKSSDVVIDYEIKGQGEPLVMLHSGMMSRDDMRVQINYFSQHYKVIALDGREQGRSTSSPEQISYELMAGDVIALLDHLNVEKANIFGQSDGGVTALLIAHLYSQRVSKLMIHGAVYTKDAYPADQREGWKNTSWNSEDEGAKDPNSFPGMAIDHYLKGQADLTNFERHYQEMAMMWATSPNLTKADLANIKIPTLVIVGDHWDISIAHTVEMHDALPNSELFIAPGATHFIHREKSDLLHKVLHDFLRQ